MHAENPSCRPRLLAIAISATVAVVAAGSGAAQDRSAAAPPEWCRISAGPSALPDLREGSGVAASRARAGVLWAHNDSAEPLLVALNEQGTVVGRVRVTGAQVDDWEDVAVGPCQGGSCVYVGDLGDNDGNRRHVTVYRVPEPSPGDRATREADAFHARYPDGPQDAESLLVLPGPEVFVITKGDPGPVAIYRFPRTPRTGRVMSLERVGDPRAAQAASRDRPTAADASRDGRWIAVRTTEYVSFHAAADLTAGRWNEAFRVDLRPLEEPRGEGIAFGADGVVFLVGEGGPRGRAGTFARMVCKF